MQPETEKSDLKCSPLDELTTDELLSELTKRSYALIGIMAQPEEGKGKPIAVRGFGKGWKESLPRLMQELSQYVGHVVAHSETFGKDLP